MIPNESAVYWLWMQRVFGPCCARFCELLRTYESAKNACEDRNGAAFARLLTPAELKRARANSPEDCADVAESCARRGIRLLTYADDAYPPLLRETRVPPALLFVTGDVGALKTLCVAGVGARHDTPYGRDAVRRICEPLAKAGVTLVSGLAYGTDAEVHRAALRAGGKTVAVLGNAIDETYPYEHRGLRVEIERTGCAVSEYEPGTKTSRYLFPQRNRIVAGLSRAVVIFEAAKRSGTMITADWALGDGREVFAVPGNITNPQSEGTNALLRQGATPATSALDLLEAVSLRGLAEARAADEPGSPGGGKPDLPDGPVAALLRDGPLSLDELIVRAKLPAHALLAELTMLEIDGVVRTLPGSRFELAAR